MSDLLGTLGPMALIFAVFYFLLIRPAQKKQKDQQKLLAGLQEGTRVMLSSGIFGTIRHLGERQVILEIAPGFELTVARAAITRPVQPEEEDFEYDDTDDTKPNFDGESGQQTAPEAR